MVMVKKKMKKTKKKKKIKKKNDVKKKKNDEICRNHKTITNVTSSTTMQYRIDEAVR